MYIRATRYSFTGDGANKGAEIYNTKAKPMWSKQKGFHSMMRSRFVGDKYSDQQMVVLRFESKEAFEKAREAVKDQREEMLKGLEKAGIKTEEVIETEEIT